MRDRLEPRPARRRFRRAPVEKRVRIIAVARACFSERRYDETTTAEIAKRADVSEGTIFHHFGTKLELLRQVAEQYASDLVAAMFANAERDFVSVDESIERAYHFVAEEGALGMESERRSTNPRIFLTVHGAVRSAIVARGTEILETWLAMGIVRPLNPGLVAQIVFPVIDEMLLKLFADPRHRIPPEHLAEVRRIVEGAVAFDPPTH